MVTPINTPQDAPFEKAPAAVMKQAEAFLKTHGPALDNEIGFLERVGNHKDKYGAMALDQSEEGGASKLRLMVDAIRDIAYFGVVNKQAILDGQHILGRDMRITREIAVDEGDRARHAAATIRQKREVPEFLPLAEDDKKAASILRKRRMSSSHEMEAIADGLMAVQSDLRALMKALGITHAARPPGPVSDTGRQ